MPYEGKTKDDHETLIDELYDELDIQQEELATAMGKIKKFSEGLISFGECFKAVDTVHRKVCDMFSKITKYK